MWLKARVLTLASVLPSLAGGEWLSRHDLYNYGSQEGQPVPTGLAGAAQLRASGNADSWYIAYTEVQ